MIILAAVILLVLWLFTIALSISLGGITNAFLIAALIMIVVRLIEGERASEFL